MNRLSFLKIIPVLGFLGFKKQAKPPVIDNADIAGASICAFSTTGGTNIVIKHGSPTDKRIREAFANGTYANLFDESLK